MDNTQNLVRYQLTDAQVIAVQGGDHTGRIILRVSADIRLTLNEMEIDFNYMTFPAGTFMVLDPPNLLANADLWFRLDTSIGTGFVEVLRC